MCSLYNMNSFQVNDTSTFALGAALIKRHAFLTFPNIHAYIEIPILSLMQNDN